MAFLNRFMMLMRSKGSDYLDGVVTTAGVGMVGNCDHNGNMWVRAVMQPTLSVFNVPAAGAKATVDSGLATFPVVASLHASISAGAAATAIHTLQLVPVQSTGIEDPPIFEKTLEAPANSTVNIDITGLQIDMVATSGDISVDKIRWRFAAAPAAGEQQSVALTYFDRA